MSSSMDINVSDLGLAPCYDVVDSTNPGILDGNFPGLSFDRHLIPTLFSLALVWIAAVSIYDAYLVYAFRHGIQEQNLICAWLIRLEPDHVTYFLLGKGLGTLAVIASLVGLFRYWRRVAIPATVFLVLFQVGLLFYLHFADRDPFIGSFLN